MPAAFAAELEATDPEGYAGPIRQALAYLEAELPPGPNDDRYVMLGEKRHFFMGMDRFEEARAVAGGKVGGGSDGERDDVGAIGDGVFDALHNPAEETAGFAGLALVGGVGVAGDGCGHALKDFDVED